MRLSKYATTTACGSGGGVWQLQQTKTYVITDVAAGLCEVVVLIVTVIPN